MVSSAMEATARDREKLGLMPLGIVEAVVMRDGIMGMALWGWWRLGIRRWRDVEHMLAKCALVHGVLC